MAPNIGMHDVRSQSFHYHRGEGLPRSGAKIRPTTLSRELFRVVNVYKPLPINPIVDAIIQLFFSFRNCLVGENNNVKIADFGLARLECWPAGTR